MLGRNGITIGNEEAIRIGHCGSWKPAGILVREGDGGDTDLSELRRARGRHGAGFGGF